MEHQMNRFSNLPELNIERKDSVGFVKAESDSDFDDQVDENEELNGGSRAVKLSIRALNFNTMMST